MKQFQLMFVLVVLLLVSPAQGKQVQGRLHLDSYSTEFFLGKFAFSPAANGHVSAEFRVSEDQPKGVTNGKTYYDNRPHNLMVSLYDDDHWVIFNKLLKDGSLCRERVGRAMHRYPVMISREPGSEHQKLSFEHSISQPLTATHMFVVISDCVLEDYPTNPPALDYSVTFTNDGSHLPADEDGVLPLFYVALFAFGGLLGQYGTLLRGILKKFHQSHLLIYLVGLALGAQVVALLLQIAHLHTYQANGLGLKWRHVGLLLAFDFYSELGQLQSELLVAFILISISAGWTLTDHFKMHKLLHPASILGLAALFFFHVYLQYSGRQFEEDFTYFHDFSHWPGACLLGLRLIMLFMFVTGMQLAHGSIPGIVRQVSPLGKMLTKIGALSKSSDGALRSVGIQSSHSGAILWKLTLVGCMWFAIFPISVIFAFCIPPIHRKLPILAATLVAHLCTLAVMTLSTLRTNSAFFEVSSLKTLGTMLDGTSVGYTKTAVD